MNERPPRARLLLIPFRREKRERGREGERRRELAASDVGKGSLNRRSRSLKGRHAAAHGERLFVRGRRWREREAEWRHFYVTRARQCVRARLSRKMENGKVGLAAGSRPQGCKQCSSSSMCVCLYVGTGRDKYAGATCFYFVSCLSFSKTQKNPTLNQELWKVSQFKCSWVSW